MPERCNLLIIPSKTIFPRQEKPKFEAENRPNKDMGGHTKNHIEAAYLLIGVALFARYSST